MAENPVETIFYQSLAYNAITAESMFQRLQAEREPIANGRISDFYKGDLQQFQKYGGVGEENIPLRFQNFIERVARGIKEAAQHPEGFSEIFYPFSGVDLSSVVPLLADNSRLVTVDSEEFFVNGFRPEAETVSVDDREEMQRDAFQKATHGMHTAEIARTSWGVAADLQLIGFDQKRGDMFKLVEHTIGEPVPEGYQTPRRKKSKFDIVIDGKRIHWTHYKMNIYPDTLSVHEINKDGIWQSLQKDLRRMVVKDDMLFFSKGGMLGSIGSIAVARSGLVRPGNFICIDVCSNPDVQLPGIALSRLPLTTLSDMAPQFDEKYIQSHKMIHPYIPLGYQDYPEKIFLAKVRD